MLSSNIVSITSMNYRKLSTSSSFYSILRFYLKQKLEKDESPLRSISTSCGCSGFGRPNEGERQARIFKKLVSGAGPRKRKKYSFMETPSKSFQEFGAVTATGSKGKPVAGKVLRRVEVLNTLFVEQITSLLATGEVSPEFLGLGLQISHVKISPDFSLVNVYWYASGTETDEKIENLLERAAGHLRHALSQLRVIGIVPPIKFHRDKTFSKLQEVEQLLAKCDFGPDFEPTPASKSFAMQHRNTKTQEEKDAGSEPGLEVVGTSPADTIEMRHDVLGVKHDLIMEEIRKSMQKREDRKMARESRVQSISDNDFEDVTSQTAETVKEETEDYHTRQKEFLKYLKQRQSTREKQLKRLTSEAKEDDFYLSEAEQRWELNMRNRLDELGLDTDIDDIFEAKDNYVDEDEYYDKLREDFK